MKKLIPFVMGSYINMLAWVSPRMAGHQGFRIFCYPFRTAIKPYQKIFLSSGVYKVIQVDDIDIQLYRWGNGPKKILLLHGWQSHSYRWKSYIEMFSHEEYSIYSLDAPGHGLSGGNFLTVPFYSKVVEQFIKETGTFDTIIGHSLGAFTALYTLSSVTQLPVKKIVLLASPGEATEFFQFYKETLRLNDKSLNHILNHFERVIEIPVDHFSAPKFASTITQPGLLIHDEDDDETSHIHSVNISQQWKNSALVITKGLGHNLKSTDIVKKVIEFVQHVPEYDKAARN
jgi:pimeloyl-ACP methyl ester carboxylesterase